MKHRKMLRMIGVALLLIIGVPGHGKAELPPAAVMAQMKGGTITAVGKDDIRIDGHTYRINPKAEIVDHEGMPLTVEGIRPNGLIKYLLKAGEIELMVVTNPQ